MNTLLGEVALGVFLGEAIQFFELDLIGVSFPLKLSNVFVEDAANGFIFGLVSGLLGELISGFGDSDVVVAAFALVFHFLIKINYF